jgi:hypothetical protein
MLSVRSFMDRASTWTTTRRFNVCTSRVLIAGCAVPLLAAGCGGALENDNVLARTKGSGAGGKGSSTSRPLGGNGGTTDGDAGASYGAAGTSYGAAGTMAGAAGSSYGAAGASSGAAGTMAGAAGADQCLGQCTDGRVCRKINVAYQCVPPSCGPELVATLNLSDRDGGLVALGGDYAYVVTKTALEVVDIHNPRDPRLVGELAGSFVGIAWQSGPRLYLADATNGLALVDVRRPELPKVMNTLPIPGGVTCVRADGAVAYLCAGDEKQKSGYLQVVDLTQPDKPVLRGRLAMPPVVRSIDSAGPVVYLADGNGQFVVVDATDLDQPRTLANLSGIGATSVKLSGSRAFVGAGDLVVIDVSAPDHPTKIANVYVPESIRSLSIEGNLVSYMSSYGYNLGSFFFTLDVSDLAQPIVSPIMFGSADEHWPGPILELKNGFAYVAVSGSLAVYDVSTPVNRRVVNSFPLESGSIVGMELQDGYAYVVDIGYMGGGSLQAVTIYDPFHPKIYGDFSVSAMGLAVRDQRAYLYAQPGGDRQLLELDLNNLYSLSASSQIGALSLEETLSGKLSGQMAVTPAGDYLYLLGKEVITVVRVGRTDDTGQPVDPELVRTLDLPGAISSRIRLTATHAFVTASISQGDSALKSGALLVFDLTDPGDPLQVGMLETPVGLSGLELSGSYAYLGAVGQGLIAVDVSSPSAPRVAGTADTPHGGEEEIAVMNNMVYLGRAAVDVTDPSNPVFRHEIDIPGSFRRVTSTGRLFTVTSGSRGKYGGWPAVLNYVDPTRCEP